jgi:phosphoribosyl 1,2-cyclic phosphodiesterase
MALRFTVLASGSSGNASFVQTQRGGLLIDIGLGPRQLAQRLAMIGASWDHVHAVLLTHTHSDHWNERTLALLRRRCIRLFCHLEHHSALSNTSEAFAGLLADGLAHNYDAGQPLEPVPDVSCRPFALMHDEPTFGFRLEAMAGLFGCTASLAYATDLGSWTAPLAQSLADVDVLALEFNHDVDMQYASGRSPFLIQRILGDAGHLSNVQAAALLQEVLRLSAPGRIQHIVQLHLSRDCNRPVLARQTAEAVLTNHDTIRLHTARHDRPGRTLCIGTHGAIQSQVRKGRPSGRLVVKEASQSVLPGFAAAEDSIS